MREQIFKQPDFIPLFDIGRAFADKTIGITGGHGVLGGIMSKRLRDKGVRFVTYEGDILDTPMLHEWIYENDFHYFFHLAAIVPVTEVQTDPLKAYEVNAIGTYNICKEIIRLQKSCWLFIASSSHVYKSRIANDGYILNEESPTNPVSIYGKTKLLAEQIAAPILEQYKIPHCIGRIFSFSSITQQGSYLVPSLRRKIESAADNGTVNINNPDSVRDMMDAESVVDCIFHLARYCYSGIINIGSGRGRRIRDIAVDIGKWLKKDIRVEGVNKAQPDSLVADITKLKSVLCQLTQEEGIQ